jgi:uncharacterized protein (DUF2164 family)
MTKGRRTGAHGHHARSGCAEKAVAPIRRYFAETWEQDVGDLKAGLLLDYSLKEIGPSVYNRAVEDTQVCFRNRVADLEATCFEKEFGFWPPERQRGRRQ